MWGPLGEFVIAGHENGEINQYSAKVRHTQIVCVNALSCNDLVNIKKKNPKNINKTTVDVVCVWTVWRDPEDGQGAQQADQ